MAAGTNFQLFSSVAACVADAQEKIENAVRGRDVAFTIPRAQAELSFRLAIDKSSRVVFFFTKGGESARDCHRLRFTVIALPDPPTPAPPEPPFELRLPQYLLPHALEFSTAQEADRKSGNTKPLPGKPDTGYICFDLTPDPGFLVIRVEEKHKDDLVYLYTPPTPPTLFVRSHDKRSYFPLRMMLTALRRAMLTPTTHGFPTTINSDFQMGWSKFDDFLRDLWADYQTAMLKLSEHKPSGEPPVYFCLDDFEGEFFYTAWKPAEHDTLKVDNPFDADDDWIHNRVSVRLDTDVSTGKIELRDAEFLPTGDYRDTLIKVLTARSSDLAAAFKLHTGTTLAATVFSSAPPDLLMLLSYEKEPPNKGFVVFWPLPDGEFIFTFDSNGDKITGGPQPQAFIHNDNPDPVINDDTYKVIHNFFRAVRLWRNRELKSE